MLLTSYQLPVADVFLNKRTRLLVSVLRDALQVEHLKQIFQEIDRDNVSEVSFQAHRRAAAFAWRCLGLLIC